MEHNFKVIIDQINQKNGKKLFDCSKISNIGSVLNHQPKLEYVGHGIQSICFKTDQGYVVKCCVKRKNSVIISKNLFLSTTKDLLNKNMPILPPIEILYEDEIWMIYTQHTCRMIDNVNTRFCYNIIKFVRQMVASDIRISDIYYRNFGIYQNKILLFDYHDIDNFDSSSNFLITNLYSLFKLLGHKLGWNVQDTTINHWDEVVANNFGQSCFPETIVTLLYSLHNRDHNQIIDCLDRTMLYIKSYIKHDFTTYHSLTIDNEDIICINYPSKTYEFLFDLVHNKHLISVLDICSCSNGIGLKLAQDFPNISVTLGCSTNEEINDTKSIINNCVTYNTSIIHSNPSDIKVPINERYDLVLYYLMLYDLLQMNKISDIFRLIKNQVGKCFVIEVPIIGDHLLSKIMDSHKNLNYDLFISPYTFRSYLCLNKIKVNRCIFIDYGNKQFKRFLFVCDV